MNLRSIWNEITYRVLIIIAGVLLLFFLAVIIFSDPLLNSLVKDKLETKANSGKNTTLHIDDMSYHLFSNSVEASGIKFSYKDSSSGGKSAYHIKVPSFEISGINWFTIIFGSGASLGTAAIDSPVLQIESVKSGKQQSRNDNQGKESGKRSPLFDKSFISSLPSRIKPLNLGRLEIHSGKFIRHSETEDETTKDTIRNFNLYISGIKIDSTVSDSSLKYIIAEDFDFDAEGIKRLYEKGGNEIKLDSINISGDDSLLTIKNFAYEPFLNRQDYFARKKYRADRRKIRFRELSIKGIDFSRIVKKSIFAASTAKINDFFVEILTDKRKAISPSFNPKMPNEILRNLKFGININKMQFTRGEINVKALRENSDTAAVLPFSNVGAEIFNLNNLEGGSKYAVIKAEGNIFKAARLNLEVHVDQRSKQLNYTNKGNLDSMSVKPMNQWLVIDELARLTDGTISKISFSAEMKDGKAHATVTPVYKNLEVKLLDKKKGEKKLKSFLAKVFKIRKENPKDGNLKTGKADSQRKADDTFFDALWIPVKKALGKVAGF